MNFTPITITRTAPVNARVYSHNIVIERKEGKKWIPFAHVTESHLRVPFMAAWDYVDRNAVGEIVDTRHTYRNCNRVHYYKTTNTPGGYDFRATF